MFPQPPAIDSRKATFGEFSFLVLPAKTQDFEQGGRSVLDLSSAFQVSSPLSLNKPVTWGAAVFSDPKQTCAFMRFL